MNARTPISGNLPVEVALAMYDTADLDDAADALEAENERMAKQNAHLWLRDEEFWKEELLDTEFQSLAMPLSVCMKELDNAAKGDVYSIGIILAQLAQIEKSAKPRAEAQLFDIYGSES